MPHNTTFHYPTDAMLAAAFEDIFGRLDRELEKCDPRDLSYYRSQLAAFTKAHEQYQTRGARPEQSGMAFVIASASRIGRTHTLRRDIGGLLRCTCEARGYCWHRALVAVAERAIDLAEDGMIGGHGSEDAEEVTPIDYSTLARGLAGRLCAARQARMAA